MQRIKHLNKKYVSKFLSFPVFVFGGFIIVSFILTFGSHFIRSASPSAANCDKTGVNMGHALNTFSSDLCEKSKALGLRYILGIVYNDENEINDLMQYASDKDYPVEEMVAQRINLAHGCGLEIIVRICDGAHGCGFAPEDLRQQEDAWYQSGIKYGRFLIKVAEKTGYTFWAHAGHNEPHGDPQTGGVTHPKGVDRIEAKFEAQFIKGVRDSGVMGSYGHKVKLITPQFDAHYMQGGRLSYQIYTEEMKKVVGDDIFDGFVGIAVATHDTEDGPESVKPIERIRQVHEYFNKPVFVTEIGMLDREFDELVENFAAVRDSDLTIGVLVFNGFFQNPQFDYHEVFKNPDYLQTVIGDCGDGTYEYGAYPSEGELGGDGETMEACAFEEAILKPCEVKGDLALSGNVSLYYDEGSGLWKGEWYVTTRVQSLPAMKYYSSPEYTGSENIDHISAGGGFERINPYADYTFRVLLPGYGLFIDASGNVKGRPHYTHGTGVLVASLGPWEDYLTAYKEPHPGFKRAEAKILPDIELETTHSSLDLFSTVYQLIEWVESLLGPKKCKGTDYAIDKLYTENETSGHESLSEHRTITYSLLDIVRGSNIMTTIGQQCEMEGGHCKVLGDLTRCNPCHTNYILLEPGDEGYDPDNLLPQYRTERVCDNLDFDGSIKDEEALIDCIGARPTSVEVKTGSKGDFTIGGGLYLLETYLKNLGLLSTRPICHQKNLGIEAVIASTLYMRDFSCGTGQTVGSGSCPGNNVCLNPGFEYIEEAHGSDNWFTSAGWYPFEAGSSKKPEFSVFNASDRNNPSIAQKFFVYGSGHTLSAGIFTPVSLDKELEAGAKIQVTGYFQAFVGPTGCGYGPHNDNLSISVGIESGNKVSDISGQNFRYSPSTNGDFRSGAGSCSDVPEWTQFSIEFEPVGDRQDFTVFIKAYSPGKGDQSVNNNVFIDDVCIQITNATGTYENTLGVNTSPSTIPGGNTSEGDGVGEGGGYCEADPGFSIPQCVTSVASKTQKAYFPYLGLVEQIPGYIDLVRPAIEESIPDLPECSDADKSKYGLCYCEEGQMDMLAQYLWQEGALDVEELEVLGFGNAAREAGIIQEPPEEEEEDPDIPDWDETYAPPIDDSFVGVLEEVENEIRVQTGKCVPKEMLAAILAAETRAQRPDGSLLKADDINRQDLFAVNNDACSRAIEGCTGITDPPRPNIDDPDRDQQLYDFRKFVWNEYPHCKANIEEVIAAGDTECVDGRSTWNHYIVCCDVRGIMQFEIGTWMLVKDKVSPISPVILANHGYPDYDFTKRERVIDSLVAAGLKLSVPSGDCERWNNDTEAVVRERAKEYNRNQAYIGNVWDLYKSYYKRFRPD